MTYFLEGTSKTNKTSKLIIKSYEGIEVSKIKRGRPRLILKKKIIS
jgi:hypothetical protein